MLKNDTFKALDTPSQHTQSPVPPREASYKYQESELTAQINVCAFYQAGTKPALLMETFLVVLGKDCVYFIADITKNTARQPPIILLGMV